MRTSVFIFGLVLLLTSEISHACGIHFSSSYLVHGSRDVLKMPRGGFLHLMEKYGVKEKWGIDEPEKVYGSKLSRAQLYAQTVAQDLCDIELASNGDESSIALYAEIRQVFEDCLGGYLEQENDWGYPRIPPQMPKPFPMDLYHEKLGSLPDEFSLYLKGAVAYYNNDMHSAIDLFNAVLMLPEQDRQYKSTWAAFMLGKSWTRIDPSQASQYYAMVRKLKDNCFMDSLGLAESSRGWEAFANLRNEDFINAFHNYVRCPNVDMLSLSLACDRALRQKTMDPALVYDSLSRQLLTFASISNYTVSKSWLDALELHGWFNNIEESEELAWMAYRLGDFDAANRWLRFTDSRDMIALWIKAKLLIREGEIDEGLKLLKQINFEAKDSDFYITVCEDVERDTLKFHEVLSQDTGYAQLINGNYSAALLEFRRSNLQSDATFIAEWVLETDELAQFVKENESSIETSKNYTHSSRNGVPIQYFNIPRYILTRRFALEGAWDKALEVSPQSGEFIADGWRIDSENLTQLLLQAKSFSTNLLRSDTHDSERAQIYFEYGKFMYEHGEKLISPLEIVAGEERFNPSQPGFPPDLAERIAKNQATYPYMHYYKTVASDMMWQAASLLPDNDADCAEALYLGGVWLKKEHRDLADKFYKALVQRNPNLLIAQQADKLRWFPAQFTDQVVYKAWGPNEWYRQRKHLTIILTAIVLFILYCMRSLRVI